MKVTESEVMGRNSGSNYKEDLKYSPVLLVRIKYTLHTGFWLGKNEGKRLFGRPRCKWEYNIKMDLREGGRGTWTELMWFRTETVLGGYCKSDNELWGSIKWGEFLD
jgi:hypothetical protein